MTLLVNGGPPDSSGNSSGPTNEAGIPEVSIKNPVTGFNELLVSELTPIVQIDAIYGIGEDIEALTALGGGTNAVDGNFVCNTGTSQYGYSVIRSRQYARYHPGESMVFRWTAIFDTINKAPNSLQMAGAFNSICGLAVGYDGENFGVVHQTGGAHETRRLQITTPEGTATNVTLTLNGVAYGPIAVTGGTAIENAQEIAAWMSDTNNQAAWQVYQNQDTIVFFKNNVGPAAGSYSISSTNIVGAFTTLKTGVALSETWTYQASFSEDTLDGNGSSSMTIDPSKGNVFFIDLQYLGYGIVPISVENPATGNPVVFHVWRFPNARTIPSLTNPTLRVGWVAASLGSTVDITVKGASGVAGIAGKALSHSATRTILNQRTGVGNSLVSVLAVRVRGEIGGEVQLGELLPDLSTFTSEGNNTVEFSFLLNPTFASSPNWAYVDQMYSIAEYDTGSISISAEGRKVAAFTVAGKTSGKFTSSDVNTRIALQRGDILCIAAIIPSGNSANASASLIWHEGY